MRSCGRVAEGAGLLSRTPPQTVATDLRPPINNNLHVFVIRDLSILATLFAVAARSRTSIGQKNGIEFQRFKFHDLRHRRAVDWLQDGRDIYDLIERHAHCVMEPLTCCEKRACTSCRRMCVIGG
jgi:hypothetical protein